MENIDVKLRTYIENNILSLYEKNDSGHGIEHIKYVIKRSFELQINLIILIWIWFM